MSCTSTAVCPDAEEICVVPSDPISDQTSAETRFADSDTHGETPTPTFRPPTRCLGNKQREGGPTRSNCQRLEKAPDSWSCWGHCVQGSVISQGDADRHVQRDHMIQADTIDVRTRHAPCVCAAPALVVEYVSPAPAVYIAHTLAFVHNFSAEQVVATVWQPQGALGEEVQCRF